MKDEEQPVHEMKYLYKMKVVMMGGAYQKMKNE